MFLDLASTSCTIGSSLFLNLVLDRLFKFWFWRFTGFTGEIHLLGSFGT